MRAVLVLLAVGSAGQAPQRASISGNVWDPQGAAIPDAEVVATSSSAKAVTGTNHSGFYSLRNLPGGEYTVAIAHPKFRSHRRKGLLLRPAQSLQLDVQLEPDDATAGDSAPVQ